MTKLWKIVEKLEDDYVQTFSTLYEKSKDPSKKCGVCVLGGIALKKGKGKFKPRTYANGLLFAATDESIDTTQYTKILTAAGIPLKVINRKYQVTLYPRTIHSERIIGKTLGEFLYRLNDSGQSFKQIAAILKKKNL